VNNTPENIPQIEVIQEKVDTNTDQQKVDASLIQQEEAQPENPNWKAYREQMKKTREEKRLAEKRAEEKEAEAAALRAAMEAAFSKQPNNYLGGSTNLVDNSAFQYEETEEQRIEKKVNAALAAREAAIEKERREKEQREYPQRLNQTYPDFEKIVTDENFDYLEYHYPEIVRPLKRLGEGFDTWSDVYHAIKKFVPNSTTAKKEAQRAEINQNKPKSMSGSTMTPSGESVSSARLTAERRAENWSRMQKSLKGLS